VSPDVRDRMNALCECIAIEQDPDIFTMLVGNSITSSNSNGKDSRSLDIPVCDPVGHEWRVGNPGSRSHDPVSRAQSGASSKSEMTRNHAVTFHHCAARIPRPERRLSCRPFSVLLLSSGGPN
jgi:hypothetical protein